MNAENEYKEKPNVNPACMLSDLSYCLAQAKALRATAAGAKVKVCDRSRWLGVLTRLMQVNQISTLLDELQAQQPKEPLISNPLREKVDEGSEVAVELSYTPSSYSISTQQV